MFKEQMFFKKDERSMLMEAIREIFWNIGNWGYLIYLVALVVLGIFLFGIYKYWQIWKTGKPDERFSQIKKRLRAFVKIIPEMLFHRRNFKNPVRGAIHSLIFWGFIILFFGMILEPISHYLGLNFLKGNVYLWYSLVLDLAGLMILAGIVFALIRRLIPKLRGTVTNDDIIVLVLLFLILVSGYKIEGIRIAMTELKTNPGWAIWSPVGLVFAKIFAGFKMSLLSNLYKIFWLSHVLLFFGLVIYIGLKFSKLLHVILAPVNIFFRSLGPKGALKPIEIDIENMDEDEVFGVNKIKEFTRKQFIDFGACTSCDICEENCPAFISGKSLSPKNLILDLKLHLLEKRDKTLIGETIKEDDLWACTTCRACDELCPVYAEHIDKIIDLRRYLVMMEGSFPQTAAGALKSLETRAHPWEGATGSRIDWAQGLKIKTLADDNKIDILYWVGCTTAFDDRNKKIAAGLAKVLKKAGIRFGILGDEEACCGDPARRLGNEYLFQEIAKQNIKTLKKYKIKKIITSCPHCYHMLKNEYPQFGFRAEIVHHTEFISELIKTDRIKFSKKIEKTATYHDSCYLSRYNDIYRPPREILKAIPELKTMEMKQNRKKGFCCGAGGGQMWMEENPAKRVNQKRIEQASQTKAELIITACPFCISMLEDGVKKAEKEEKLKLKDIIELVEEAI